MSVPSHVRDDLFRACLHEIAHQVIAESFGVEGWVEIERNPNGGIHEKYFVGRFKHSPTPNGHACRMISLAGLLAEQVHADPSCNPWELIELLDLGIIELSASDAEGAGKVTFRRLAECLERVRCEWGTIVRRATELSGSLEANIYRHPHSRRRL